MFGAQCGGCAGGRRVHGPARPAAAADGDGEGAVAICDELMHTAIVRQASDIHIDPDEKQMHVRLRVERGAGTDSARFRSPYTTA